MGSHSTPGSADVIGPLSNMGRKMGVGQLSPEAQEGVCRKLDSGDIFN